MSGAQQVESMTGAPGKEDLGRPLQWIIVLRVVVASVLLVTLALLQAARSSQLLEDSLPLLQLLGSGVFLATGCYAFAIWRRWNLGRLGVVQLGGDLVFITSLQYVTGGIDSGFSFLYLLAIIAGAFLFHGRGAFAMAIGSTLAYGGLVGGQASGWVHVPRLFVNPVLEMGFWDFLTNICFNSAVFFVMALLCGYFAEQLRATHLQLRVKEKTLESLRALTHQIVTSMGSGLLTIDAGDRVSFINATGERLLGIGAGGALGRGLRQVLPDISEPPPGGPLPGRLEVGHERPDGVSLHLGCSFSPLNGVPGGRILIFQDLTEVKAAEESARRNERLAAVGALSAAMAHEIRNPLASMRGSIEMLSKELQLTDYQGRLMAIVLREADRLNRLLTEFLQFAKPQETKPRPVNLGGLIRESAEVFLQEQREGSRLEIQIDVPAGITVAGDAGQLRQVAWNLFLNARDAMKGSGKVRVSARSAPGEAQESGMASRKEIGGVVPGWVELCFEDSGAGIPAEAIHRIFEPFFTTKEQGTGLGLAT
ncbi:MAG: histidine kinase dimerization/phospho-acceptor domain-containing protein, partial [Deltaproteobacteria bacterium]|nr:histidine kinase dimerization/phospho-acceptor domain-containing protein [Deltaproteobacteria bacterium]